MMSSNLNNNHSTSIFGGGALPSPTAAAVTLCLSHVLRRRLRLGLLLSSSIESISSRLGEVARLKVLCHERALHQFTGSFNSALPETTLMGLSFFNGDGSGSNGDFGKPQSRMSRRDLFDGRRWTNILLAANVLLMASLIKGSCGG